MRFKFDAVLTATYEVEAETQAEAEELVCDLFFEDMGVEPDNLVLKE